MKQSLHRSGQRGFSLVEMMVAVAITMAVSAGMLTLLMSTRTNNVAQNAMEQLQDDQRLALTRLIDTVQNAGYFPNPTTSSASVEFPSTNGSNSLTPFPQFATASQTVTGITSASAPGDSLAVRYEASGVVAGVGDGVMDCSGSLNANATPLLMVNRFSVDSNGNLNCTVNGRTIPLAGGVSSFKVLYGVDTDGDGAADEYLPASTVGSNWLAVKSVRVTLTFLNPMAGRPGQTASAVTLQPITQIIPVLNQL